MIRQSSVRIDRLNRLVRLLEYYGRRNRTVSTGELVIKGGYDEEGRTAESARRQIQRDIQHLRDDFWMEIEFDKNRQGYRLYSSGKYVLHRYLGGENERRTSV